MKLIRLTDDRYVLDAGDITQQQMQEIREFWQEWWKKEITTPEVIVFGGSKIPLEYEDRRESFLDARLEKLEELVNNLVKEFL